MSPYLFVSINSRSSPFVSFEAHFEWYTLSIQILQICQSLARISSVNPSWIFLLIFIWSTWQVQPQLLSLNWVNFGSKLSNETEVWGLQETDAMLVSFPTTPLFVLYLEQQYSTFWYYPYRFLVLCWWNYFFPYAQVDLKLCFFGGMRT